MDVNEFISKYTNHPILFIGAGISLRYLENSYTWDGLLKFISNQLKSNDEYYLDLKHHNTKAGVTSYENIAKALRTEFDTVLQTDRNGKFQPINDKFYDNASKDIQVSRFNLYVSSLLSDLSIKPSMVEELKEFKKTRKNIGTIITTNYDKLIESVFEFKELIGNDILLSSPYGSIYKIHGCVNTPDKIIIDADDYQQFDEKYELIRAQLLSLFIHNPIIFLGYNVGDDNIKKILKTIFTYVPVNTDLAKKIKDNFLLVEYEPESNNLVISDHDIETKDFGTIRINKIKTDDYSSIYQAISSLTLPVTAQDIRKVQSIVKEIYEGGKIKVSITEDIDSLKNEDKVIAIGSKKTIDYRYETLSEILSKYFNIIEESNSQILTLIDKQTIQSNQYFPIYGFSLINPDLTSSTGLMSQQDGKVSNFISSIKESKKSIFKSIQEILDSDSVAISYKVDCIAYNVYQGNINLKEVKAYLKTYHKKNTTDYKKLLVIYVYMKYKPEVDKAINLAS